jgi:hypothetical protein
MQYNRQQGQGPSNTGFTNVNPPGYGPPSNAQPGSQYANFAPGFGQPPPQSAQQPGQYSQQPPIQTSQQQPAQYPPNAPAPLYPSQGQFGQGFNPNVGATPSTYAVPYNSFGGPVVSGPPISAHSTNSFSAGPAPTTFSSPSAQATSTPPAGPKASVQFFSVSGGTPVPSSSASTLPGPPPSVPGPAVGPPQGGFAGPPIHGPPNTGFTSPMASSMPSQPGMGGPVDQQQSSGFPQPPSTGAYAHNATLDNLMPSSLPLLSEVDLSLKCKKEFIRPTVGK